MAIVIEVVPANLSSAHGDIYFNVFEATKATDKILYPDYKYIADVYINGSKVATQKAFPHPLNNRGVFNIGTVVRNYLLTVFNPIPVNLLAQTFASGEFFIDVQVKFGEEYGGVSTFGIIADTPRRYFNHYNGRLVGATTILGSYIDKFASNRPLVNNKVRVSSNFVFIPYLPSTSGVIPIEITVYSGSGIVAGATFDYMFPVVFGSTGSGSVSNTISITSVSAYNLLQLNVSPVIINTLWPGTIDYTANYYTVKIGTQTYRFDIYCERIYTPRTIHFLNKIGGIESFEFSKRSNSRLEKESKGIGVSRVTTYGSTFQGRIVNNNYNTYSTSYSEKITLNSSNIKEGQYKWLAEMFLSPQKWIEDESGMLVPISFTNTNYEFKTAVNDKASSFLQVEVDFNEDLNTQYL